MASPPGQVGWMTGPSRLLLPVIKAHSFLVFTVPSSLQVGPLRVRIYSAM